MQIFVLVLHTPPEKLKFALVVRCKLNLCVWVCVCIEQQQQLLVNGICPV